MNSKKINISKNIELETEIFEDKYGNVHKVSDEEVSEVLSHAQYEINSLTNKYRVICISKDKHYMFENFKVSKKALKTYNEDDTEIYKHFVYEYCKNYYNRPRVEKIESGDIYVAHSIDNDYDIDSDKHIDMIDFKENYFASIKEIIHNYLSITMHLESCRDYTIQRKLVNVTPDNFNNFVDFILCSNMFSLNDIIKLSDRGHHITVGCALLNICKYINYKDGVKHLKKRGLLTNHLEKSYVCPPNAYISAPKGVSWILYNLFPYRSPNIWAVKYAIDSAKTDEEAENIEKTLGVYRYSQLCDLYNHKEWINVITKEFKDLKFEYFTDYKEDELIDKKRLSSTYLKEFLTKNSDIDGYLRDYYLREFISEIHLDTIVYNKINDSRDVQLVKKFSNNYDLDKSEINAYFEHIYIDLKIERILKGGYINDEGRVSPRMGNLETRIIKIDSDIQQWEREEYDIKDNDNDLYLLLFGRKDNSIGEEILKHKIKLKTFYSDEDALKKITTTWLNGEDLTENDIKDFYKGGINEGKVRDEIAEYEKKIEILKRKIK